MSPIANQIPFSGATQVAGGYLLPPEQGEILVNGILVETGALSIAGDARSTTARKTNFPIWLGRPTAGPVAEGAAKGVTGAAFGQGVLNIQKFASIVLFTDEQIEDLQNGDLNVLADAGVRQALSVSIDAHSNGVSSGGGIAATSATVSGVQANSVFDSPLLPGTVDAGIRWVSSTRDSLQTAVSAAMGILEANGYGDPSDIAVELGFGFQQYLRDQRDTQGRPLYDGGTYAGQSIDALYGLDRAHSTNLASTSAANTITCTTTSGTPNLTALTLGTAGVYVGQPITGAGIPAATTIASITYDVNSLITGITLSANATASASITATVPQPVALVAHKPNIHVRVRDDVTVKVSNEASVVSGGTTFNLFQQNLTAILYELRLGWFVHDIARSVVPIFH